MQEEGEPGGIYQPGMVQYRGTRITRIMQHIND